MLGNILDAVRSIDLKSFAGGLAVAGSAAKAWSSYRKARQAEAAGSHYIVKGGVDKHGYRWSTLSVKSWTGVEMRLLSVEFYWPPFTPFHCLMAAEVFYPAMVKAPERSSHRLDDKHIALSPDKPVSLTCVIKLNRWTRLCALWQARARIKVTAETIDAQSRRTSLKLRSRSVDWDRPPQA